MLFIVLSKPVPQMQVLAHESSSTLLPDCSASSKAAPLAIGERIHSPTALRSVLGPLFGNPRARTAAVPFVTNIAAHAGLRWGGGGFWKARRERRVPPNCPAPPNGRQPRAGPALLWAAKGAPESGGATWSCRGRRGTGALAVSRPFMFLLLLSFLLFWAFTAICPLSVCGLPSFVLVAAQVGRLKQKVPRGKVTATASRVLCSSSLLPDPLRARVNHHGVILGVLLYLLPW